MDRAYNFRRKLNYESTLETSGLQKIGYFG